MLSLAFSALLLSAPPEKAERPPVDKRPAPKARRAMTDARLDAFLRKLDPDVRIQGPMRQLTVEGTILLVVSDAAADRMRIMTPLDDVADLKRADLERLLQANFDAVLDARYAVARGQVWSAFIHPLRDLTPDELASGLAQVVVAAQTYGSAYTSGALMFSGGDSSALHRDLYEKLRKKGRTHI